MKALVAMLTLAVAGTAAAQEPAKEGLKDLKIGDRVELQLKNGFAVQGEIVSVDPKVTEVEKMKIIIIDIGYEYPELRGHVGVERIQVKTAKKLPRLGDKEIQQREKARQEALKRMETEDMARRARIAAQELEEEKARREAEKKDKADRLKGVGADLEARAEMLKKGAELHARFPESAGWGPEKAKEIAKKTIIHVPASADERDFMANIETWILYRDYLKEQATKEKEKEAVEEIKKETPAPAPKPEEPPK